MIAWLAFPFLLFAFILFMSLDIQERMNFVEKKKLCFDVEGSRTISHFKIEIFNHL